MKKMRNVYFKVRKTLKDQEKSGDLITNKILPENITNKKAPGTDPHNKKQDLNYKLQPFKLSKQFCPICCSFFCSYHKIFDHDKYNLIFKDTDYHTYHAEELSHISGKYFQNLSKKEKKNILPSYENSSNLKQKYLHEIPNHIRTYRCLHKPSCYFSGNPSNTKKKRTKLRKNELEMLK